MMRQELHDWCNNGLSTIMSALLKLVREESEAYDDIAAWHAPSECYGDAYRGIVRQVDKLFADQGIRPSELEAILTRRGISQKWLFYSGTGRLIDEAKDREQIREQQRQEWIRIHFAGRRVVPLRSPEERKAALVRCDDSYPY